MAKSNKATQIRQVTKSTDELAADSYRAMVEKFGVVEANNQVIKMAAQMREMGAADWANAYVRAAFAAA